MTNNAKRFKNVLDNENLEKIGEAATIRNSSGGLSESDPAALRIYHGDLMIIKAYLEGKHGLGALEFGEGSQFLGAYRELEKEVMGRVEEHQAKWSKLVAQSASHHQIIDYIKEVRSKHVPLVPFMYLYSFFRSQNIIKVMRESDTARLQSYVRWRVYDESVEAGRAGEVVEKARLLSLMKRNVSYKRFMTDVWDEFER